MLRSVVAAAPLGEAVQIERQHAAKTTSSLGSYCTSCPRLELVFATLAFSAPLMQVRLRQRLLLKKAWPPQTEPVQPIEAQHAQRTKSAPGVDEGYSRSGNSGATRSLVKESLGCCSVAGPLSPTRQRGNFLALRVGLNPCWCSRPRLDSCKERQASPLENLAEGSCNLR